MKMLYSRILFTHLSDMAVPNSATGRACSGVVCMEFLPHAPLRVHTREDRAYSLEEWLMSQLEAVTFHSRGNWWKRSGISLRR